MNNSSYEILNDISEGIVVLNEKSEIFFWNRYMEDTTGLGKQEIVGRSIYSILPNLNVNYFNKAIRDVLNNGCKIFFSAAMHSELACGKGKFNLKISRFDKDDTKLLLIEFIDVTNQFIQISKLRTHVHELYEVNSGLKEKEKVIEKLAYYDNLTGLANRTLFYSLAERFLNHAQRNNHLLGLMFIDVDKLKSINDTYGHEAGDKVLAKVASILKNSTSKSDLVVRHGGDEFLILLPHMETVDHCKTIISKLVDSQDKVINYNGTEINILFSIGISIYPHHGNSIDKLITQADKAMYTAKSRVSNDSCFAVSCE